MHHTARPQPDAHLNTPTQELRWREISTCSPAILFTPQANYATPFGRETLWTSSDVACHEFENGVPKALAQKCAAWAHARLEKLLPCEHGARNRSSDSISCRKSLRYLLRSL